MVTHEVIQVLCIDSPPALEVSLTHVAVRIEDVCEGLQRVGIDHSGSILSLVILKLAIEEGLLYVIEAGLIWGHDRVFGVILSETKSERGFVAKAGWQAI